MNAAFGLPIARGESARLVSSDGAPVWPVSDPQQEAALEQLTEIFGVKLVETPARAGTAPAIRDEEVVALGSDLRAHAELYAHLTGRRPRIAVDLEQLLRGPRPCVLLATHRRLDSRLMDFLYPAAGPISGPIMGIGQGGSGPIMGIGQGGSGPIPGIICAEAPGALLTQVLLRSATVALRAPMTIPRRDLYFVLPPGQPGGRPEQYEMYQAPLDQVRRWLEGAPGLLSIVTHADGVDLCLGSLVLCPMDQKPAQSDPDRPALCQERGYCHRLRTSLEHAQRSGELTRPEALGARVLLLHVCNGVLLEDAIIDPAWSFGRRLIASPRIGAFVTSWQHAGERSVDPLAEALLDGATLGDAVAAYSRSEPSHVLRERFCLFGDPALQLPAQPQAEAIAPASAREHRAEPTHAGAPARVQRTRFLEEMLLEHWPERERLDRAPVRAAIAARLAAIDSESSESALADAVLDLMCESRTTPPKDAWTRGALFRAADREEPPCFRCGSPARRLISFLRRYDFNRRLFLCWRCGLLEDAPAELPPLATELLDSRTVRITPRLDGVRSVKCGVRAIEPGPSAFRLPIDGFDRETQTIRLALPIPKRTIVHAYLICDDHFAAVMIESAGPNIL